MTLKEMNAFRVLARKTVRKIYGLIKEDESWRIGINKETGDILQGAETVSLRLRWSRHTERMNNERMPKQIVIVSMVGTRKWERQ
jgi:hypothetical protein